MVVGANLEGDNAYDNGSRARRYINLGNFDMWELIFEQWLFWKFSPSKDEKMPDENDATKKALETKDKKIVDEKAGNNKYLINYKAIVKVYWEKTKLDPKPRLVNEVLRKSPDGNYYRAINGQSQLIDSLSVIDTNYTISSSIFFIYDNGDTIDSGFTNDSK